MRWLLPSLALLLHPSADDEQARALYSALRKNIVSAETVSVDYSMTVSIPRGRMKASISGSLRLKGRDHWCFTQKQQDDQRPEQHLSMTCFWDGRRFVAQGASPERLDPQEFSGVLRHMLLDSLLGIVFRGNPPCPPAIAPPKEELIRDGGTETIDGVAARIIQYEMGFEGEKFSARSWIDPAGPRLLKRELSLGPRDFKIEETFTAWALNAPIADSTFVFASLGRLAAARAKQMARSVALFGTYTGRMPSSLDQLVARPKDLPEGVIWPEGGFALGGSVPKDPWGRPFSLRNEGARQVVASLGADGKAGGTGDDEDVQVDVPLSLRMPITGPTPRLKAQYEARITLHLIVAAVKAYRETYGELPKKKADLFEKPQAESVWPEGGWLPGRKMPLDPWGQEFRLITELQSACAQVQDPKARALSLKMLSAEELAALEKGATPTLGAAERAEIETLVKQLRDDDLETRQRAQLELRRYGPTIDETLAAFLATEKDIEAKSRILEIRRSLPHPLPPWRTELAPLAMVIFGDGQPAAMAINERNASISLKTLATAEADFRANDRDWNHVNDFWTADVAGLYTVKDADGQSVKLIELSVALADGAPLEGGAAGGRLPALKTFGLSMPKAGYWFRAMETAADVNPPEQLRQDTGGQPQMGKVHNTSRFGYCAYPAEYGASGTRTFILNENNTIFWKDTQGEPVLEWPSDADLAAEWKKLD
jgi:hypothetical protein